ncbi:uncharacterized protein LOC110341621 [Mesocricetus auratus]|uniref:Uncharacterized protein LOC110341621 n=1 Tax=Mesocricetus auratus TaxID=10036 RepID=A0ABM2X9A1_MESAU|nr:uncharacterized protein LOC110341621 [Mesocricetus auratus]
MCKPLASLVNYMTSPLRLTVSLPLSSLLLVWQPLLYFQPGYILPVHWMKQLYPSTNKRSVCSQHTERPLVTKGASPLPLSSGLHEAGLLVVTLSALTTIFYPLNRVGRLRVTRESPETVSPSQSFFPKAVYVSRLLRSSNSVREMLSGLQSLKEEVCSCATTHSGGGLRVARCLLFTSSSGNSLCVCRIPKQGWIPFTYGLRLLRHHFDLWCADTERVRSVMQKTSLRDRLP